MKKLLLLLFLSIATNLMAQKDTLYFDADWNRTTKVEAKFYRPLPLEKLAETYYIVKDFYANGNLKRRGVISNIEKEEWIGTTDWYTKKGQKAKETYSENGIVKTTGIYRNDQPHDGDFNSTISKESLIVLLSHYKKGIRIDNQYYGFLNHENVFKIVDTIQYKSGEPYHGRKIEYDQNLLHVHTYTKGRLVKTSVEKFPFGEALFLVIYSDNGYKTMHPKSKSKVNEVTYLDKTKRSGKVILYTDKDQNHGTLEYHRNKIIAIDLVFDEAGLTNQYKLEKANILVINASSKQNRITYKLYPKLNIVDTFAYKDFLPNKEEMYLIGNGNAIAYFYLDDLKEAISNCRVKNNKPYHGIVIQYNEETDTFYFRKYKDGKRIETVKNLTKEELIKLLK